MPARVYVGSNPTLSAKMKMGLSSGPFSFWERGVWTNPLVRQNRRERFWTTDQRRSAPQGLLPWMASSNPTPGLVQPSRLHSRQLKGGRFAVWVDENYRVTFRFESGHACEVDYEDYH